MSTYGLWLSAAGMKVSEHRQAILANNLANAETTGFKRDLAVVAQRRVASQETLSSVTTRHPVLDGMTGGINVRPTQANLAQGPIEATGRPLDAALEGPGFFVVSNGESTRYTRDGNFSVDRNGNLVVAGGGGRWKLVDEGGAAIVLDGQGREAAVFSDGTIRQGAEVVGKLAIVLPAAGQAPRKSGENLFEADAGAMTPGKTHVVPAALERSNVDIMPGLAEMITANRAYEMNANLIRLQDEASGSVISRVGRVA